MAPDHPQAVGKVSYNVWLDAFDDDLWSSEPRAEKMRLVASSFVEYQWVKTRLEILQDWHSRQDSWRLPTSHEQNLESWDIDHHCFWVGWFVPRLYRHYEDRFFGPGQCVNNCSGSVLNSLTISKAFKVVYKPGGTSKNKLFALYSPDSNGVCRAISVPGGVCSVLFFEEWRDDTVTGRTTRQKSWLRNVMSGSLTEPLSLAPEATPEPQRNKRRCQVSYDWSWLKKDFVVEDESSPSNDSDGDGSEYVFSGRQSSESDSDSETSHKSTRFNTFDDNADDGVEEEQIARNSTEVGPMQRDTSAHTSSIVSTKNTALDNRPSARTRSNKQPEAEIISALLPPLLPFGSPSLSMRVTSRDKSKERSKTPEKGRVTWADVKMLHTQTKKRQIGQYGELDSRFKRSRPSRQPATPFAKAEDENTNDEDQVKVEKIHDSDDKIQFVSEVSLARTGKKQPVTASVEPYMAPSPRESTAFVLDFIAADKLIKVARLQDAFSRRATLKAFRKHLASTSEAESDALAHNIAENEDRDTRIMLAEALVADLEETLSGVANPHTGSIVLSDSSTW
ncbi:hypothetical protein LY78DRAFT_680674 [Colletotrichum sublineola]|nr:hypothetical protein LY78DRAFT_680674 [Colletotrichum sublineola]